MRTFFFRRRPIPGIKNIFSQRLIPDFEIFPRCPNLEYWEHFSSFSYTGYWYFFHVAFSRILWNYFLRLLSPCYRLLKTFFYLRLPILDIEILIMSLCPRLLNTSPTPLPYPGYWNSPPFSQYPWYSDSFLVVLTWIIEDHFSVVLSRILRTFSCRLVPDYSGLFSLSPYVIYWEFFLLSLSRILRRFFRHHITDIEKDFRRRSIPDNENVFLVALSISGYMTLPCRIEVHIFYEIFWDWEIRTYCFLRESCYFSSHPIQDIESI